MQIYRKLWHLSFLWAPVLYYYFLTRSQAILLSAAFLLFFVLLDLVRLNWKRGNEIAFRLFPFLLREQERKTFNTSIYFALSCLLCAFFFEKRVAVLAIALLCVGDPVAAIVGTRYGTVRILNKSLQGSLACFVVCLLVARLLFGWTIAFWAALTATFFELVSSRLNDNLSIPLFSGLMVTFLLESPEPSGPMQILLLFFRVFLLFGVGTSLTGVLARHFIVHHYFRQYPNSFRKRTPWRPSVSIVKPLSGLEGGDEENLTSFCRLCYRGLWELLFVVQNGRDPILPVVDRLRLRFPEVRMRVLYAGRDPSVTDKMGELLRGAREARGEVLVFSDAAARVPPDYLDRVIDPLGDTRIGVVTAAAAYFGARNVWAALSAHLVNLLGLNLYYTLAYFDRLHSANGCTLALRREVFEEVGGFSRVAHQLCDSHALAQEVHRKGYRIHLLDRMIPVFYPRVSFWEWLARMHRLAVVYRTYAPHAYPILLFQLGLVNSLLYWWVTPGSLVGPILALASLCAETFSHLRMNALYIRDRRTVLFIWLLPVLLVAAPFFWASPYFSRVVRWRGNRYFVDRDGVATRLKEAS